MEKLKAVYEKCELYAHDGRCERNTALHYSNVPDEFVRWLTEQGLDVNVENYYGRSPLDRHAALGDNTVKLLFELGADVERVDRYRNSPLHTAASFFTRIQFDFLWKKEQMFT
ncbi:ankyrin repeat domain-containing protein [Gemella morbillorum]|uniref:ankyrin repeat domain-containing protein n=1 Tax=Gemella morbillorum TaxID=29391 RepID=UPI0032AFEB78